MSKVLEYKEDEEVDKLEAIQTELTNVRRGLFMRFDAVSRHQAALELENDALDSRVAVLEKALGIIRDKRDVKKIIKIS